MVRKFATGDKVMAKWPDSDLYFNGTVVDFNDIQYLVRFDDEDQSEHPVRYSHVTVPFSRTSRSRSRSRGRTPTRKAVTKSAGRKSPGRPSSKSRKASKSPAKSPSQTTRMRKSTRSKADLFKEEVKTVITTTTSSTKKVSQVPVRQSARLQGAATAVDGKVNSIKVDTDAVSKKLHESKTWKGFFKRMTLGLWHNSLPLVTLMLVSVMPHVLMQMCTKSSCDLAAPIFPKQMKSYWNQKAFYLSAGFFLCSFLLALIPLGKTFKLNNGITVRCNGFIGLVVALAALPLMIYLQYNVLSIYNLFRPMLVSCQLMAAVLSVVVFVKSFYVSKKELNPFGTRGYYLADFLEGRQCAPSLLGFDLKVIIFRTTILMNVVAQVIVFLKNFDNTQVVNYTLSVAVGLQLLFCVDLLLFEETILTSYEYVRHGFGLIAIMDYMSPAFVFTFYTRYIMNHGKELPWYCLVGVISLHFLGYIISRGANCQKHAFKTNASGPTVAHLETIAAGGGSRLLVSGWWGIVRHPNYLGDMLVYLSWSLICGFEHALPWLLFAMACLYLLVRTVHVETDCKRKYGLAWTTYTSRVPYRLIPKVL